jgi:hypothetical protein
MSRSSELIFASGPSAIGTLLGGAIARGMRSRIPITKSSRARDASVRSQDRMHYNAIVSPMLFSIPYTGS